jgi:hypothetical protein
MLVNVEFIDVFSTRLRNLYIIVHGYDGFVSQYPAQTWTTRNGEVVIPCRVDNPEMEDFLQVFLVDINRTEDDCHDSNDTLCTEVRK